MDIKIITLGLVIGLLAGTGIGYYSCMPENTYLKNQNALLASQAGKVPGLQDQVNTLQNQVNTLQNTKTNYETQISTLQSEEDTLNNQISYYQNQIAQKQQEINQISAPKVEVWIGQIYADQVYKHIFFTCIIANFGEKPVENISFEIEIYNRGPNSTMTAQKIIIYDKGIDPSVADLPANSFRCFPAVVNYPSDWDDPYLKLYSLPTWE